MNASRTRRVALATVVAALALPVSTASAGDGYLATVLGLWYNNTTGQPADYRSGDGKTHLFTYYSLGKDPLSSSQQVVGYLDSAAFVGVAYNHVFDRTTNSGSYRLSGTIDPAGVNPPVPMLATVTTGVDRNGLEITTFLTGSIAGVPVAASLPPNLG